MNSASDPRIPTDRQASVRGLSEPPLLDQTVPETLSRAAGRWPDNEFAIFPEAGLRWSYRSFADAVDRLATGFLQLGLEPGDRIGIWSPNRPEWLLVQFASARAGLILVTVNPAYQAEELKHALQLVGMRALVLAPRYADADLPGILCSIRPETADPVPAERCGEELPDLELAVHRARGRPRKRGAPV